MGLRTLALITCFAAASAGAQVFVVGMKTAEADAITEFHPTRVELPGGTLDEQGRLGLIRDLEAEQGFAHRQMPFGPGVELLANGNMTPRDDAYRKMLYEKGQAAGPGDRLEVTALKFESDRIVIDFNGGPYAKHRFLSHISINDNPLAHLGPAAVGCRVILRFEGAVPDVTAADVKALLDPLVDFHAKTAVEAYADTLSPQVRDAVAQHTILVGMDKRMVQAALGEPPQRHREHTKPGDPDSPFWEEWIYPSGSLYNPDATQFVRFEKGRVSRLEIAAAGRPIEVHDHNELTGPMAPVLEARTIQNGDEHGGEDHAHPAPSLRKPGEVLDDPGAQTVGKVHLPGSTPSSSPAKNFASAE